jgi:predicted nucleic acid-binding protein
LPHEALFLAAQGHRFYHLLGGRRAMALPDFLSGARAALLAMPLLTRDRRRYNTHFNQLEFAVPASP